MQGKTLEVLEEEQLERIKKGVIEAGPTKFQIKLYSSKFLIFLLFLFLFFIFFHLFIIINRVFAIVGPVHKYNEICVQYFLWKLGQSTKTIHQNGIAN